MFKLFHFRRCGTNALKIHCNLIWIYIMRNESWHHKCIHWPFSKPVWELYAHDVVLLKNYWFQRKRENRKSCPLVHSPHACTRLGRGAARNQEISPARACGEQNPITGSRNPNTGSLSGSAWAGSRGCNIPLWNLAILQAG